MGSKAVQEYLRAMKVTVSREKQGDKEAMKDMLKKKVRELRGRSWQYSGVQVFVPMQEI